jgi:hypothetical protein
MPTDTALRRYRSARFSLWLSEQLTRSGLTSHGLAARMTRQSPSSLKGTANLVKSWIRGCRTPHSETIFGVGQLLAPDIKDVNGLTALHAAGYYAEAITLAGHLVQKPSDKFEPLFVAAVLTELPWLHASLDRAVDKTRGIDQRRVTISGYFSIADKFFTHSLGLAWLNMRGGRRWKLSRPHAKLLEIALSAAKLETADPVAHSYIVHKALTLFVANFSARWQRSLDAYCEQLPQGSAELPAPGIRGLRYANLYHFVQTDQEIDSLISELRE